MHIKSMLSNFFLRYSLCFSLCLSMFLHDSQFWFLAASSLAEAEIPPAQQLPAAAVPALRFDDASSEKCQKKND